MIQIEPVGFVHSERKEVRDDHWKGEARIVLAESFGDEALAGIEEFSHLEILFHFHKADPSKMTRGAAHPRHNPDWPRVGIFVRRGKNRPNHLGLTVVKLLKVEGTTLYVSRLDAIDGTPVIDIKPLMRAFLPAEEIRQPAWADEIMKDYWK